MSTGQDARRAAGGSAVSRVRDRGLALTVLVFALSMGATYAFWKHVHADADSIRRTAFDIRVEEALHHVDARLKRHENMLRGLAGLAAASHTLTRAEFHTYVESLGYTKRSPEIRRIGLAVVATPPSARQPQGGGQLAGLAEHGREASTHARVPVLYLEPPAGGDGMALDRDLYADGPRREAMEYARATAGISMSPHRVAMLSGTHAPADADTDLFMPLFTVPALDNVEDAGHMRAWVFASISTADMTAALLADDLHHLAANIDVHIRHPMPATGDARLYAIADPSPMRRAASTELATQRHLSFGGRDWVVELRARPGFRAAREDRHPLMLVSGAAGCSLLLTGFTWALATSRTRARETAATMNDELIRSESRLRDVNEALENRVAERTAQLEAVAERLTLAVATSNTGLWDWSLVTHEVHYSPEWAAQLGLLPGEAGTTIDTWQDRLHPDDRARATAILHEHLRKPGTPWEIELRWRHRNGSYRTVLARTCAYADASGQVVRVIGSHVDITERKQAEDALVGLTRELREAWRQLSKVEEADRRWLAGELHDSIGSALTALNLNLTLIGEHLPRESAPMLHARLADSIGLLQETVETVRGLMAQLRPPVLDDYGLATALRWYAEHTAARAEMRIGFRLSGDDARFPPETEITLFRIAQGALTNVMKHAHAREVSIALDIQPRGLTLSIADDGCGFAPHEHGADAERPHWGLVTMRERAQSLGGQCTVDSTPGAGTRVTVKVPIDT